MQATNRMDGNIHAMHKLLDNLVRRQNWPDQFIEALEVCDHTILAQEMRDAYDLLQPSCEYIPPPSLSLKQFELMCTNKHCRLCVRSLIIVLPVMCTELQISTRVHFIIITVNAHFLTTTTQFLSTCLSLLR